MLGDIPGPEGVSHGGPEGFLHTCWLSKRGGVHVIRPRECSPDAQDPC
jgi:hypothetical protein